jgi:hypothetical protein
MSGTLVAALPRCDLLLKTPILFPLFSGEFRSCNRGIYEICGSKFRSDRF